MTGAVLGVRTLAVHPIVWRSRVRGALIIAATEERAFEQVDRELVDAIVVMGAPALERAGATTSTTRSPSSCSAG